MISTLNIIYIHILFDEQHECLCNNNCKSLKNNIETQTNYMRNVTYKIDHGLLVI